MAHSHEHNEDELWDTTETGTDREKAEAFNSLADLKLQQNDFATANSCAAQSVYLYQRENDNAGVSSSSLLEGRALMGLKRFDEALVAFDRVVEYERANPREQWLAWALFLSADSYSELKQYKLAADTFESSARLYVSADNHWAAANTMAHAGENLLKCKDYEKAELIAQETLDYAQESEHTVATIRGLIVRGKALAAQRTDETIQAAEVAFAEARAVCKYTDNAFVKHHAYREFGYLLSKQGMSHKLAALLGELRDITREFGDAECLALADFLEANAAFNDGQLEIAQRLLDDCIPMLTYGKNRESTLRALILQILVHYVNDDYWQVVAMFERAKSFAAVNGLGIEDQDLHVYYAQALFETGETVKAKAAIDSIPMAETMSADTLAAVEGLYAKMAAKCYDWQETGAQAEKAISHYEQCEVHDSRLAEQFELRGRAKAAKGDIEGAKEDCNRALMYFGQEANVESSERVGKYLGDLSRPVQQMIYDAEQETD